MSRAEDLKVLTDSLEEVLTIQFPAHDQWGTGHVEWWKARNKVVDLLAEQIKALLGEKP